MIRKIRRLRVNRSRVLCFYRKNARCQRNLGFQKGDDFLHSGGSFQVCVCVNCVSLLVSCRIWFDKFVSIVHFMLMLVHSSGQVAFRRHPVNGSFFPCVLYFVAQRMSWSFFSRNSTGDFLHRKSSPKMIYPPVHLDK